MPDAHIASLGSPTPYPVSPHPTQSVPVAVTCTSSLLALLPDRVLTLSGFVRA
ncbi:hypothetical protein L227DRAFT_582060, partial [Lentinus tigrinus ALCF2SS1-6]